MDIYSLLLYFFIYGFLGWCTEVAYAGVKEAKFVNRGFLNGPICPIYGVGVCVVVLLLLPLKSHVILLYITSTILVTVLEGVTGFAMDKIFHNKWWDYSNQPLNIGGYVCLIFSLAWGVGCVIIVKFVHPLIAVPVEHIPFIVGVILLVIFGGAMIADLYVTASAIFKMNKRIDAMDKIAKELHELSDQLGEGIFNQVEEAKEKQEAAKEKYDETRERLAEAGAEFKERSQELKEKSLDFKERAQDIDISDELAKRIAGLKDSYQELSDKGSAVTRRLVRAFPKMESRKSNEQLNKIREAFAARMKK